MCFCKISHRGFCNCRSRALSLQSGSTILIHQEIRGSCTFPRAGQQLLDRDVVCSLRWQVSCIRLGCVPPTRCVGYKYYTSQARPRTRQGRIPLLPIQTFINYNVKLFIEDAMSLS
eukprot:sb/3476601/